MSKSISLAVAAFGSIFRISRRHQGRHRANTVPGDLYVGFTSVRPLSVGQRH